jgi:hypothetical protein
MKRLAVIPMLALLILTAGALLTPGAFSQTGYGPRQTAKLIYGSQRPASPSSLLFEIDYVNPDDSGAKPPAVRRVVVVTPKGARIDTSVPAKCTAGDPELMLLGAAACPPASKVGEGVARVDTGIPGPYRIVTVDIEFFNNTNELIYLNTIRGIGARVVVRGRIIGGRRIETEPGMLPGMPPDGGAIDYARIVDPVYTIRRDDQLRAYHTTPPRCPRSGRWTGRIILTYADGETQAVPTHSPCRSRQR